MTLIFHSCPFLSLFLDTVSVVLAVGTVEQPSWVCARGAACCGGLVSRGGPQHSWYSVGPLPDGAPSQAWPPPCRAQGPSSSVLPRDLSAGRASAGALGRALCGSCCFPESATAIAEAACVHVALHTHTCLIFRLWKSVLTPPSSRFSLLLRCHAPAAVGLTEQHRPGSPCPRDTGVCGSRALSHQQM